MKYILLSAIMAILMSCNNQRRYEISTSAATSIANDGSKIEMREITVIDTYTGKVWLKPFDVEKDTNHKWIYLGTPADK